MSTFLRIMSPIHNFILICAFAASIGFGMLIAFNKRVATEKTENAITVLGISIPLHTLTEVKVSDL